MNMSYIQVAEIVAWASEAGRQEVLMARHEGRDLDQEGGMGLWQSFQARFPSGEFPGCYDDAVHLYRQVYRTAVENCDKTLKDQW